MICPRCRSFHQRDLPAIAALSSYSGRRVAAVQLFFDKEQQLLLRHFLLNVEDVARVNLQ